MGSMLSATDLEADLSVYYVHAYTRFIKKETQSTIDSTSVEPLDLNLTAIEHLQSLIFLPQLPKPVPSEPPASASRGRLWCRADLSLVSSTAAISPFFLLFSIFQIYFSLGLVQLNFSQVDGNPSSCAPFTLPHNSIILRFSYNFLAVATIWAVMLTKRIWAPKKP